MKKFNRQRLFSKYLFPASIFLFFQILISSCQKLVQIPPPVDKIVTSQVFADSSDATAAVFGLYTKLYTTGSTGNPPPSVLTRSGITIDAGMAADELYPTTSLGTSYTSQAPFYTNSLAADDATVSGRNNNSNIWQQAYPIIYQANACLEGLNIAPNFISKNQLIGETKLIRAFIYFNLVNLYGPVPLAVTTDYQTNAQLARAPITQVYQQIVADLISAQTLLSTNYPATGRGRPNKFTATALLARVYLYQKQWANAEIAAQQVINSGLYNLSSLNNVFLSNIATPTNTEPIWQLLPTYPGGYDVTEGYIFTYSSLPPQYVISNYLLSAFETNDQRKANWLNSVTYGGQTYYYPFKYKIAGVDASTIPKENYTVLRLAEQYLILAEAKAQQGNDLPGAAAALNVIRIRAGLAGTIAATQSQLLTAIYHERQVELFCEWGHRWYDLKRTGQVDAVMGGATGVCASKGGIWSSNWALWPIPLSETYKGINLTQNIGY
jgi:hypothetical protein